MKAKLSQVNLGSITIEGVMLPDGTFGITLAQLNEIVQFDTYQQNAQRTLKAACGKDFTLIKAETDRNLRQKTKENIITIDQLNFVLVKLAVKGHKKAEELASDLVGLSLYQLFSDAFGVRFELEERKAWLVARMEGKVARRQFTDAIKDYLMRHDIADSDYGKSIYRIVSIALNTAINNENGGRDHLDQATLKFIEYTEHHAMLLVDRNDTEPLEAIKTAIKLNAK